MTDQITGCEALKINDQNELVVPVCMGGTAIIGCNNIGECQKLYYDRGANPNSTPIEHEGKVFTVMTPLTEEELIRRLKENPA